MHHLLDEMSNVHLEHRQFFCENDHIKYLMACWIHHSIAYQEELLPNHVVCRVPFNVGEVTPYKDG